MGLHRKALSGALKMIIPDDRVCRGNELGTFCSQDNVLEVVNLLNSPRRPLFSEEKVQIEILSRLLASIPIDLPKSCQ